MTDNAIAGGLFPLRPFMHPFNEAQLAAIFRAQVRHYPVGRSRSPGGRAHKRWKRQRSAGRR